MSDDVVSPSYDPAVSKSGHFGRFHPDAAASDAIPRLAPGVGLIVVLLLSFGLWGRGVAGGLRIDRGGALVTKTQSLRARGAARRSYFFNMREDQMPSILNEALQWLDRAEQAREVAGQLNDPGARKAVLELAESFERLARAAAAPTAARRKELATQDQERR